jgi:hypothetical protein
MTRPGFSRRGVLTAAAVAPFAPSAHAARGLELSTPRAQLTAFMKLFVSLKPETVWYTYTGVLDIAIPGQPIAPLVGCTTLIRRQVVPQPDGSFHVHLWEANVYHRPGETTLLREMVNPVTGRTVQPFHYREGLTTFVYSESAPYVMTGGNGLLNRSAKPFDLTWQQAGDTIWTARELYADRPHPLDPAVWKHESSGPRLQFSSISTHTGRVSELADPNVANASSTFTYQATMGWWPWLLMGQRPGYLIWRASGLKLPRADAIPAGTRTMVAQVYPKIFDPGEPWGEHALLWTDYPQQRKPAADT